MNLCISYPLHQTFLSVFLPSPNTFNTVVTQGKRRSDEYEVNPFVSSYAHNFTSLDFSNGCKGKGEQKENTNMIWLFRLYEWRQEEGKDVKILRARVFWIFCCSSAGQRQGRDGLTGALHAKTTPTFTPQYKRRRILHLKPLLTVCKY